MVRKSGEKFDLMLQFMCSPEATPPLVSEFLYVIEVPAAENPPLLDDKGCLVAAFGDAPKGAKRLKTVRKQVGESLVSMILFGVYRSPSEFIRVACSLDHPFDLLCDVPDCTIKLSCSQKGQLCWRRSVCKL